MLTAILALGTTIIGGVKGHLENKQKISQAVVENKMRLAASETEFNHEWEMKSLQGAGFKDDVLFYGFIGMFVWAGFDPEGAKVFFLNLDSLPEWFVKVWFAIVASVLGIKKIGDYLPGAIQGVKAAFKGKE